MLTKKNDSLVIIHKLLIEGRILSAKEIDKSLIINYFDGLEYLLSLIIQEEGKSETFENYLLDFCKDFHLIHLLNKN